MERKKTIVTIAGIALIITAILILFNALSEKKTALEKTERNFQAFKELVYDYQLIYNETQKFQKRLNMRSVNGVLQAVDDITSSIGLKEKLSSVKLGSQKKHIDFIEENVVLTIQSASLNELINLFYKMEYTPIGLLIKSCKMKKNFSNPDRFDITMDIAFIKTFN